MATFARLVVFFSVLQRVVSDAAFSNPQQADSGSAYGVGQDVTQNEVYAVGGNLSITWSTDEQALTLDMWQAYPDGSNFYDSDPGLQYLPDSSEFPCILLHLLITNGLQRLYRVQDRVL